MDSRNRLWWVMGGVALLLVVVLTGGLYWLRPVDSVARADLALPRPAQDAQPFEFVATPGVAAAPERPAGETPAGDPAAAGTSDTADTADTADALPASTLAAASPAAEAVATDSRQVAARQPKPRITLDTQEPAGAADTQAAAPEVRAIATTSARTGSADAPAVAAPAAEAKRSVPLAKLAPKLPLHEFWVQVGSFASRARANALEQRLSDHGIISRVTTRSTDAEVFFRVRVGPYGSRKEAEKFLAWVQQVDGMDGSYISEVRNSGG
ncbi:MAG: SPOR domain-containing protein [Spirochaetaceae bacterium]|nr:SPOR domain-containing protein [Spirochaetaceae bacterium]